MAVWFEGEIGIGCGVFDVRHAVEDHGRFFVAITSLMPGIYEAGSKMGNAFLETTKAFFEDQDVARSSAL